MATKRRAARRRWSASACSRWARSRPAVGVWLTHVSVQEASARSLMLKLMKDGKTDEAKEVEVAYRFSESDPGWADAFFAWLRERDALQNNYKRCTHEALGQTFVYDRVLPSDKRFVMGIIGDWGTGNRQSVMLAEKMARELKPDLFVHLGDVYYAGTAKQFNDYYVEPLINAFGVVVAADLKGRVWTLPGVSGECVCIVRARISRRANRTTAITLEASPSSMCARRCVRACALLLFLCVVVLLT